MNFKDILHNSMICIQKSSYSNLDINSLLEPFGGIKHLKNLTDMLNRYNEHFHLGVSC